MHPLSPLVVLLPLFSPPVFQPPAPRTPLAPRIDAVLRKVDVQHAKNTVPLADDASFLRRVSLDLTGVIPSADESKAFLDDKAADKRAKLVDRLLASDGFVRHFATQFDVLLMDRRPGDQVKLPEWQDYLRQSFASNKPLGQLTSELLSNDGADPKKRPAARFFLDRKVEPHLLTKDIGRVFLGMNLHCAQCHDHPLVDGFKQDMYYGIYGFLNRTYAFADKATKVSVVAEKGDGETTFESVFVPKVVHTAMPRLPGAKVVSEPKFKKGEEYVSVPAKGERGVPKFSRRTQLAGEIVGHPRFARSMANRTWAWLFGRGIVHPVEFDHDANPPAYPALLDLLAADFRATNHDFKQLVRGIVLSETYQRSSRASADGSGPAPQTFLAAAVRPLTPEQFAWSLYRATGQIDADLAAPKASAAAVYAKHAPAVQQVANLFAGAAGEVAGDFEATLDQSLFLRNSKTWDALLTPRAGTLVERLGKITDNAALADALYLAVFVRRPTTEERDDVAAFLTRPGVERTRAIQDAAWALLTSAEFRFNH